VLSLEQTTEVKFHYVFKLGCRWGWVFNFTPRPLCPRRRYSVPIVQEAGWIQGPVWTGVENRSPGRPVAIPSVLRSKIRKCICSDCVFISRSQLPRGLRRGPSSARLLRLRVRIPPVLWMSVASVVCCQVEISARVRSFDQRSPTEFVSFSVIRCNSNPLHIHWVRRKEVRISRKEILRVFLWKKLINVKITVINVPELEDHWQVATQLEKLVVVTWPHTC